MNQGNDTMLGDHLSQAALADYATALALGQPVQAAHPAAAAHLTGCAACRAELDALLVLLETAYDKTLPLAVPPAPTLAFLAGQGAPPAGEALGRLVIRFSEALLATLRPPALAGALRGRQLLYRYVQEPEAVADPQVTIQVLGDDEDWQHVSLWVAVDLPDRDPFDQSGSRVLVAAGDLVRSGVTDESGSVDIDSIPVALLSQLRFEITPPARELGR